jgi:hypothetical protein
MTLPLLTSEGNRRMFVDGHWVERCLVCCFRVLAQGLRQTSVQRTAILLCTFLGCEGCFGFIFLWLRIPVMGAGNSFCFV